MIERLGESDCLVTEIHPPIELASFGKGPYPKHAGHHDGKPGHAKTLATAIAFKRLDRLSKNSSARRKSPAAKYAVAR